MHYAKTLFALTAAVISVVVACSPQPTPIAPTRVSGTPAVSTREKWQDDWEKLIAEAKKEETVVISSPAATELTRALSKSFEDKFGVQIEFITGRANELGAKVLAERRAGLYIQDVLIIGTSTAIPVLKPVGALEPVDKQLILPEVLDKNVWWRGDYTWIEPEHLQLIFLAYVSTSLYVNTNLVAPGEITSYRDLLNPKWKGKISIDDPTVSGTGQAWFQSLASGVMDLDYLRELAKQQPTIMRDERLALESLAQGKYAIQIGAPADEAVTFRDLGAPIAFVSAAEGSYLSASLGGLSLLNRAPHPNAAKLFINWLLTKEGLTVFSRAHGTQTTRLDVPTDFLDPTRVREPGKKYVESYTLDFSLKRAEASRLAKEVFGVK